MMMGGGLGPCVTLVLDYQSCVLLIFKKGTHVTEFTVSESFFQNDLWQKEFKSGQNKIHVWINFWSIVQIILLKMVKRKCLNT